MLSHCVEGNIEKSYQILKSLWDKGYSPHDIITNIFRVCRNHPMAEYIKLEYIKVTPAIIDNPLCTFLYRRNVYSCMLETKYRISMSYMYVQFHNYESQGLVKHECVHVHTSVCVCVYMIPMLWYLSCIKATLFVYRRLVTPT